MESPARIHRCDPLMGRPDHLVESLSDSSKRSPPGIPRRDPTMSSPNGISKRDFNNISPSESHHFDLPGLCRNGTPCWDKPMGPSDEHRPMASPTWISRLAPRVASPDGIPTWDPGMGLSAGTPYGIPRRDTHMCLLQTSPNGIPNGIPSWDPRWNPPTGSMGSPGAHCEFTLFRHMLRRPQQNE